jgi:hypothetical protein
LEDENNFPTAMNQSIYLMISVPYTALGITGFLIYRGCKKNAEYRKALELAAGMPSPIVVQSNPGAT